MIVNFRTEPFIIIENIVKCIGAKINKFETYNLSDIATILIKFIGIIYNLPITLALI